jgi:hypothetical protein
MQACIPLLSRVVVAGLLSARAEATFLIGNWPTLWQANERNERAGKGMVPVYEIAPG